MNSYKQYVVTGVDRYGKRFRFTYNNAMWAFGINLWKGSVWGVLDNGKRKLLKRAYN